MRLANRRSRLRAELLRRQPGFDQSLNFALLRVPAELFLAEYQLIADRHFEHAAPGWNQLPLLDPQLVPLQNLGRQTDSPGGIASMRTEFDRDA
jgi:hypothetical protein